MSQMRGVLPRDLKQKNTQEILRALAGEKTFTINDITMATSISRLTVNKALESFIRDEFVIECGKGNSTNVGGKKPTEYTLNPDRYIICISPAQMQITFTLLSLNYTETGRTAISTQARFMELSYEEYIGKIADVIRNLLAEYKVSPEKVLGIVACFGGIINRRDGIIISAYPRHWGSNLPVARDIQDALGFKTNVIIDNVSKIASGVLMFDLEMVGRRAAVVYADYGVSITLSEDGKIPETVHHLSGELGHMCLDPHDTEVCGCGATGCFEVLISERRIRDKIDQLEKSIRDELLKDYDGTYDLRIHILKKENDPAAEELRNYMADYVGLALRTVYLGFDPDFIVLTGVLSHVPDSFLERVRKQIRRNIYFGTIDHIDLRRDNRDLTDLLNRGALNIVLSSLTDKGEK